MDTRTRKNRKVTKAQMKALEAINTRRHASTHGTSTSHLQFYGCLIQDRHQGYPGHVLTERGRVALKTGIIDYSIPDTRQRYAQGDRGLWEMRLGDSFIDYDLRTPVDGGFLAVDYRGRVVVFREPTERDFKAESYALTFQEVDAITQLKAAFSAAPVALKERNKILGTGIVGSHESEWLQVAHLRRDLKEAHTRADSEKARADELHDLLEATLKLHEERVLKRDRQHEADLKAWEEAYELLKAQKEDDLW